MKDILETLLSCKSKGITITSDDNGHNLRVKGNIAALTDDERAFIRTRKEDILSLLRNARSTSYGNISALPDQNDYALSSAQKGLWIASQLQDAGTAYNIPMTVIFEGILDRQELTAAFDRLIERHEILRTVFREDEYGNIRQYVRPAGISHFSIDYTDLRHDPESVEAQVLQHCALPFDLSTGPLLRASLFRTSDEQWVFTYVMHHIISDGWSMSILINELATLYFNTTPLPALKIQYRDYAAWQQEQLKDDLMLAHGAYWHEQFNTPLPVLAMPADKIRPLIRSYQGGVIKKVIPAAQGKLLKELCQEAGSTLFMGLLALVNTLLYRYTFQEDIIIGTQIAGREHADLENQMGLYLNTLPLRVRFKGEDSFRELLRTVKDITLASYEHQAYPFDKLIQELPLQRDMSRNPLFDVSVVLQNANLSSTVSLDGTATLRIRPYQGDTNRISKYDLSFDFTENEDEISTMLVYNKAIYTVDTAEQLAEHLLQLLAVIVDVPDQPVQQLQFLSASEIHRQLYEWNDTATAYPRDQSIAALFEKQAAATPDKIAVAARGQRLTYAELDRRSAQLAAYLHTNHHIVPGQLVGIMLDKSDWLIIAILGILKAGGAYVPIDVDYPESRKQFILEDTGVSVVITQTDYMFDLADFKGDIFAIDVQLDTLEGQMAAVYGPLAYVMYTSGSTGTPKGVIVEQRSVIRLVEGTNYVQLQGNEVLLSTGAVAFDATTFEYWSMLLHGGTLVLCSKEELLDTAKLEAIIRREKVDMMWFTAGWFNQLLERSISIFEGLKTILVGGDKLSSVHINTCLRQYPALKIINGYGPTENTTFSLTYPVVPGHINIPIGKPISNSTVYILDNLLQLCPAGVIGEICVGGDGLASGYLNNAALTSERFVPHPFQQGAFLYKTGDLGRWLPDGNVAFTGRKDEQIKIRGYRIEPGEIENILQEYPGVDAAVVIPKEDASGHKLLVGYIVSKVALNAATLRIWLKDRLPVYMLPDQYILLDRMPLNNNGKADKHVLLQLEGQQLDTGVAFEAPQTDIEKKLAAIWEELLERKNIGLKDNFFELGGHSLKATLLCSQILKILLVKIELKDVFAIPVLQVQAALIEKAAHTAYADIEAAPVQEYYPLSSAQKRLFFMQEFAPESTSYNIPIVSYLGKNIGSQRIADIIKLLISRHESLRTTFVRIDGVAFQKIHDDVDFHLDEYTCSQQEFAAFMRDYIRRFDLSVAPLFRSALVNVEDTGYVWILDVHHIISDGTSFQVLIDEFMQLYQGNHLPELRLQYRDFSTWQNNLLQSGELDQQKQYWMSRFSDGIPVLDFPADRQRPASFTFKGAHIVFNIDAQTTASIRELGKKHNATLQMSLLAVLKVLLFKYTGQESLVIGCGVAGRRHPDLERIVGLFVNSLAIKSRLSDQMSFDTFYRTIISDCIEAYGNQDIQFEDLVDMLQVDRDASRNPVFDVSLVVQNFSKSKSDHAALIDDTAAAVQWNGSGTAKLDMDWLVEEKGEELKVTLEYYEEIYDHARIERMVKHFLNVLNIILDNPAVLLSDISLPDKEETLSLFEHYVNGTLQEVPAETIHARFEAQCQLTPDNIAVSDGAGQLTYKELDALSNRVAGYLKDELKIQVGAGVAMLQTGGKDVLVSMLGIVKAGGVYIPLDPEHPEERLLYILRDAAVNILITNKDLIEMANRLQWRSATLQHVICIDSLQVYAEKGILRSELMRKELWDQIGGLAVDAIAQGGWIDSYTGEDFNDTEMREYSENAFLKLRGYLHKDMRVLEIGCSSGLTMFRIAPEVGHYYGTDLSSTILEKTRETADVGNHTNITLNCMPAHDIDLIPEGEFDLVIINSVIQCFDGHNYLRDVLVKAIAKMKDKGLMFLGDLMDEERREEMIASLVAFKESNPETGRFTKTDWGVELFVSRDYLCDMMNDSTGITAVTCTEKIHTVSNELTRYRFDALLNIDKTAAAVVGKRKKYQHDLHNILLQQDSLSDVIVQHTDLAYIIYTSGSTGEPKGVMVEHGPLVTRLLAEKELLHADQQLVTAMTTNFCFDVSLLETFFPLVTGGRTVAIARDILQEPEKLIDVLVNEKVTVLQGTPGFIKSILLDTKASLSRHSLRHLAIGGESMTGKLVSELHRKLPGVLINNHYGPTESVIDAIVLEDVKTFTQNIIGRPIANTRVYILSDQSGLAPVGATGEICIGGPGLARGYMNRGDLTNQRFVPDPFVKDGRMYRTGDLGRWLPDGNIQFAGRKDEQVKIRGYRIELGEIEKILQRHTAIIDAVVVVRRTQNEDKELVAYIVSHEQLDATNIRAYLRQTLPVYMLPSDFIYLDQLPVTSSGKVDRKRLSEPKKNGIINIAEYISPRNNTERELALIWQEVLGRDRVGAKDNFFSLGGHSLKATRLASQIHKKFEVKLALKDLFIHTVLEQQAALIRQSSRMAFALIPSLPTRESYVLSSSQRRLWVLSQFNASSVAYNMPAVYVFEGTLLQAKLIAAFDALITRHESLRTVFREAENGEVRQFILPVASSRFQITYEDMRGVKDQRQQVSQLVQQTCTTPFDIANGPLLRARLFQVEDNQWVFCYVMHHIISDGWSMEVLIRELLTYYNAADIRMEPLRIHYKDYAEWQQNLFHAPAFKRLADYWRRQFLGELPVLQMPADKARPAVKTYNGGLVKRQFSVKELKAFCQQEGATLFMGLLATVNALLYRYTGQKDIIVGSPVAGREHADLSGQIGFYVNTLALRTHFSGAAGFANLLAQIKEVRCLRIPGISF
jgi:amino acid adenylation domain-containing protein